MHPICGSLPQSIPHSRNNMAQKDCSAESNAHEGLRVDHNDRGLYLAHNSSPLMLKRVLKEASYRSFFALDALRLHVLPKHFYTPVPDYRWLRANRELWIERASLRGVAWDLAAQLEWLGDICRPYYHEVAGLQSFHEITARRVGPGFGPIEVAAPALLRQGKSPAEGDRNRQRRIHGLHAARDPDE